MGKKKAEIYDREIDEFVRRHMSYVRFRARRLCPQRADSDDLVNTTMERAVRAYHRFKPGEGPSRRLRERAWLMRILKNARFDECRRHRGKTFVSCDGERRASPERGEQPPWELLEMKDVEDAAAALPVRYRQVFELFHFERCDYATIARRTQLRSGTIGTRLMRARRHLRKQLERRLREKHTWRER